jgi:hypothetical protein
LAAGKANPIGPMRETRIDRVRGTDSASEPKRQVEMTVRIDTAAGPGQPTIAVHGWLSVAEVPEFERLVTETGLPVRIDLTHLVEADLEGRQSLLRQQERGARLVGASPYLRLALESTARAESERANK